MARDNSRHRSTVLDFREPDLLWELAAEGGTAETWELAEAMGFGEQDRQGLAIRLSWMRRYGMVRRDEKSGVWLLSPGGERVTEARIRAATKTSIERLPDEAMIEVMSSITTHYRHADDPMIAHMLRREFLFGTQPR